MSSTTTGFPQEQQRRGAQWPVGIDYIPTEEEKGVFKECNNESFWYRSVPFSAIGMAITQVLHTRGTLTGSPRFGSLPKVLFAGFCGYLAGKMSYMKACQEKFKRLENSPLGEALRYRTGLPQQYANRDQQSEMSDPDTQSFEPVFQQAEAPRPNYSSDYEYSFKPDAPMQMERPDDFSTPVPVQPSVEAEEQRRKPILYEDLRLKNRENYEVTLTQKAETLMHKSSPEKEPERPKKGVKKNIYGDTWEE